MIAPSDAEVSLGNTIFFTCAAAFGETPPQLTWHRNDSGIIRNADEVNISSSIISERGVNFIVSILELCGVELSDEGLYFCQATYTFNPDLTSRVYFTVDVLEPEGGHCSYNFADVVKI